MAAELKNGFRLGVILAAVVGLGVASVICVNALKKRGSPDRAGDKMHDRVYINLGAN